jgi:hypothetical protein
MPRHQTNIFPGTVLAVKRAHESLAPGTLSVGNVTVLDTNLNRSPYAYEANPAAERARYQYDQDKVHSPREMQSYLVFICNLLVLGAAFAQVCGQFWHCSRVLEFLCSSRDESLPGRLDKLGDLRFT